MIKVEIINEITCEDLENKINKSLWELEQLSDFKLINIKYSTAMIDYQDKEILGTDIDYSAMIIYEFGGK